MKKNLKTLGLIGGALAAVVAGVALVKRGQNEDEEFETEETED